MVSAEVEPKLTAAPPTGHPLRLRPGALVVFEGLDRSGKSTQRDRLGRLAWADPGPVFVHMPSGLTLLTEAIYGLTENVRIQSAWARQLLHLACHAENMPAITNARRSSGVVLDRWWWSTVAYGWYAGQLATTGVSEALFRGVIDSVWAHQTADIVFLFTTPFEHDELNRDEVARGYADLAAEHPALAVTVPLDDPEATTGFLVATMRERGLVVD
jgi:thymidylate kinase